jgi:hypothetical protein
MCEYPITYRTAGEEGSSTFEGRYLTFVESDLVHPYHADGFVDKGDPVLVGDNIVGVAMTSAAAATDLIAIDTEGIWYLNVLGCISNGGSAGVAHTGVAGDPVYIQRTPGTDVYLLSGEQESDKFAPFGYILGATTASTTVPTLVAVKVHWARDDALENVGNSTTPMALTVADKVGHHKFYSTAMTSGTNYGDYCRLDVSGAGVEAIAGRSKALLQIAGVANAHGRHDTLELDTSAGSVTGIGTGHRANLVLPARTIPAGGEYYGAMSEISIPASGSMASVTKCAIHEFGTTGGDATAQKTVKNLFSIDTLSVGTGNMVYIHTNAGTQLGTMRIMVNGTAYWLPLMQAE